MNYTDAQIWQIIAILGVGTYAIRFSFLGLIGKRPLPHWALRLLRYTPMAIIPAMVAPMLAWPVANDGVADPIRLIAALVTLATGIWFKNVIISIGSGLAVFYVLTALVG